MTPPPDARIKEVLAGVLDLDPARIPDSFMRHDAASWDSLNHLRLISSLEAALGLRFTMGEVRAMEGLAEIRRAVSARLARP